MSLILAPCSLCDYQHTMPSPPFWVVGYGPHCREINEVRPALEAGSDVLNPLIQNPGPRDNLL